MKITTGPIRSLAAGVGFDAGQGTFNIELHIFELDDVDVQTIGVSYTLPFGK